MHGQQKISRSRSIDDSPLIAHVTRTRDASTFLHACVAWESLDSIHNVT